MTMMIKTRNMIENLVKEGSFKWLIRSRSSFDEEFEEMKNSPLAAKNWIQELSPVANIVVRRCAKILGISTSELQQNFDTEASESVKHPSCYARNILEYSCFRALALSTQVTGYLDDKKFRRMTFDMMVAWEFPAADSQPFVSMEEDVTIGAESFSRIAPAVPVIANVIISDNLFEVLTASTAGRLQFSIYEKYLGGLERAIKRLKSQSESSILSTFRLAKGEQILEVDGTVTSQPVLQHVGISTWPGRLVLTDHALYFEAHRVVSYDKPIRYDLSDDLKQVVRAELTGPWGTKLFDKAVSYKSISLLEPVVMEFPELKGHTRRDYWLAIIREILHVHRFINKFQIMGAKRDEVLLKATLGILRVQALREMNSSSPMVYETLLMFNLCDQLPGGDRILEGLADMSCSRELDRSNSSITRGRMYSIPALSVASNLGFVFGTSPNDNETTLSVGEISVGEMTPLETAVKESKRNYRKVVDAQATVDGVKADGIDTNLAVMKELLLPVIEVGKWLLSLAYWEDPSKSLIFCLFFSYIIYRGWLGYVSAAMLMFMAVFMVITRYCSHGNVEELKVQAPPAMTTVEQLLAVQNAISQIEELVQDGNVILLKFRALLLSLFPQVSEKYITSNVQDETNYILDPTKLRRGCNIPDIVKPKKIDSNMEAREAQASEKFAASLAVVALVLALLPSKYMILVVFLEIFTRYSPWRKASTERWTRRLREWWFSIPAAPVTLEREKEDKKRR